MNNVTHNSEPSAGCELKVLLVDDDHGMLTTCERSLRSQFCVETAESGLAALTKMAESGPYAVVLADRDMPGMDGVELLRKVRDRWPETVRMMLTGNADLDLVIRLVNENNIFRFLTKPCPTQFIVKALNDSLKLYQLAVAEKELLNKTLSGSIKLLTDILSMVESPFFSQPQYLRDAITGSIQRIGLENAWEVNLAVMLASIGNITIPAETLVRARTGQPLSNAEQGMLSNLPETSSRLLANIPRLEGVARIVRFQNKCFDGTGVPSEGGAGNDIPAGARLLKIILDFMDLHRATSQDDSAFGILRGRQGVYDPALLAAFQEAFEHKSRGSAPPVLVTLSVSVKELEVGMRLRSNVETKNGMLVLASDHQITPMILEKIRNFESVVGLKGPILVERLKTPNDG